MHFTPTCVINPEYLGIIFVVNSYHYPLPFGVQHLMRSLNTLSSSPWNASFLSVAFKAFVLTKELYVISFRMALIPFMWAPPSWSNHLPKVLLPNASTWTLIISSYEFWGHTTIQKHLPCFSFFTCKPGIHMVPVLQDCGN